MNRPESLVQRATYLCPHGKWASPQPIEEVEIGDWVIAADPESGEQAARRVTDVIVGDGAQLVELTIDGDTITATDHHPFWVTSGPGKRGVAMAALPGSLSADPSYGPSEAIQIAPR